LDNLLFLAKQSSCPRGAGFATDFFAPLQGIFTSFYPCPREFVAYFQKLSKAGMGMLEFD
jgi:hypothetical protein